MERSTWSNTFFLLVGLIVPALLTACSNDHKYAGSPPEIDSQHEVIVLKATAGGVDDVRFRHKVHAEYYGNTCMVCHSHTSARDSSIWSCSTCHDANDAQGLCGTIGDGHACMSGQCLRCHQQLDPDPTPQCTQCHIPPQKGIFFDAPVRGLDYRTETLKGSTDAAGTFKYLPGETITFSLGTIALGSAFARPVMTPLDLVSSATSVTNATVTNIARLLQTLDENGDPSDGIVIPFAAWNAAWNRDILFTLPTDSFGSQPDLIALLVTLNTATVFSDGPHSLVTASTAQANFQSSIDEMFPPPAAVQIKGPPNTHFVLSGTAMASAGQDYVYQWYRADSDTGANEEAIAGASGTSYYPIPADVGKWLVFEVTPYLGGSTYGTPVRSAWSGTVTSTSTVRTYAFLGSAGQVDRYTIRLQSAGTATVNIESYEAWNSACGNFTCGACHTPNAGPVDLGFLASSIGCSNDNLITNAFLFSGASGSLGTLISSKTGMEPCPAAGGATGYPGCDAPGAFSTRSPFNPLLSSALAAGDYTLAIGAQDLSEEDARSGVNTAGTAYFSSVWDGYHSAYLLYGSKYFVTFTLP